MSSLRNGKPPKKKIYIIAICIVIIKIFSLNSAWVERFYSTGFFKYFAICFRAITGWLPFSVGDVLYFLAGLWILIKFIRLVQSLFTMPQKGQRLGFALLRLLFISLTVYIIFNIFWGLNYDRKGIAYQLQLPSLKYDTADLSTVQFLLLQKVNSSKQALLRQQAKYPSNKELFNRAAACYAQARQVFPFITYKPASIKASIFSWWGNYFGFTGYYNPFTGEAQVNTTVPKFLLPYTTCHEMAHQLGYAKEDEANFVGYLAAANSTDTLFHYSTYLDLFIYANRRLYFFDSAQARASAKLLLPQVKDDITEWRNFARAHRSPIEPAISWMYAKYLTANRQPRGMLTYDDVIANLIAYYKKFGKI